MTAFYNEIDPYCAQWLRNLIDAGHIAPGVVDERSIEDITPNELRDYTQCHFFAGIGVWSYALRLAGWPDDRPVWTGSCPCQPFSAAGKGAGFADERHLWPAWQHLINQCRPPVIFGEQVASAAVGPWIDLVHADLEGMGYAFGSVPFPSAGVGAPHIRDRNFWMADAADTGREGRFFLPERSVERATRTRGVAGSVGDTNGAGSFARRQAASPAGHGGSAFADGDVCGVADSDGRQRDGLAVVRGNERDGADDGRSEGVGSVAACGIVRDERPGPTNGFWRAADWLLCTDGKWRPVEPGTFPLAHGIANRVGRLRAYGNAINAEAAATVIRAYMEARQTLAARIAA